MMDMEVKTKHWENLFSVIQCSYTIDRHVDFFNWLQNSVNNILPHDMLIASWGDFYEDKKSGHHDDQNHKSDLNYDVASNISGISTQIIFESSSKTNDFMKQLHQEWLNNNRRWYAVNQLQLLDNNHALNTDFLSQLKQFNSLLVYGVSDLRGNNDCLYVFFSKEKVFSVKDSVMGVIMPHIDNVLRKIQHLQPLEVLNDKEAAGLGEMCSGLSSRELEIIHWVKSGKTNHEIGMILDISQNTVKSHLKRIFQKLNVTRRAQAVAILSNSSIQ